MSTTAVTEKQEILSKIKEFFGVDTTRFGIFEGPSLYDMMPIVFEGQKAFFTLDIQGERRAVRADVHFCGTRQRHERFFKHDFVLMGQIEETYPNNFNGCEFLAYYRPDQKALGIFLIKNPPSS